MHPSPVIRPSTFADRDAILSFIQLQGFNPRDSITWDSLQMTAMTAWLGDRLIGAIPMEPRILQLPENKTLRALHETVVAIDEEHRGGGLGSKMQSTIAEQRPGNAEIVTVFREDPQSPAYRWYLKNGFNSLMHIESWFCEKPLASGAEVKLWEWTDPAAPWNLFEHPMPPGRVRRHLRDWLAVHPYRARYSFWIIADGPDSCALLGVGIMHSQTMRADVLDFVAPDMPAMNSLLHAIESAAANKGWTPVRIPLAANDPLTSAAKSRGYQPQWSFDLLAKPLTSDLPPNANFWRYAGIDYI